MRAGPPPWLRPPCLVKSDVHDIADAHVHAEVCSGGIRFSAQGFAEDDAAWTQEAWTSVFPLEHAICLCNTLATGKDTRLEEEAWGRLYPRIFSLDSHTSSDETNPAQQEIWFYPMNERRLVFRMLVGPLVPALVSLFSWAQANLEPVEAGARGGQRRQLRRGLELLEVAARRIRARTSG